MSIVILFLGLTYAYLARLGSEWLIFSFPKVFWLSTFFILLVSLFLRKLLVAYDTDNTRLLKRKLLFALIASILFSVCQYMGWHQLHSQNLHLTTATSVSYLYVLTGLHAAHVLVGLIILVVAYFRARKHTQNTVDALLYFSDSVRRDKLMLLTHYWHTIDALWVFLFMCFLYNHT